MIQEQRWLWSCCSWHSCCSPCHPTPSANQAHLRRLQGFAFYMQPMLMPLVAEMPGGAEGSRLSQLAVHITLWGAYLVLGLRSYWGYTLRTCWGLLPIVHGTVHQVARSSRARGVRASKGQLLCSWQWRGRQGAAYCNTQQHHAGANMLAAVALCASQAWHVGRMVAWACLALQHTAQTQSLMSCGYWDLHDDDGAHSFAPAFSCLPTIAAAVSP